MKLDSTALGTLVKRPVRQVRGGTDTGGIVRLLWTVVAVTAFGALGGCNRSADLTSVREGAAEKAVRRYDTVQALASRGRVIVAGTQDGAALVSHDAGVSWQRKALGSASLIGLTGCPDGTFVGIDFYHRIWSADGNGDNWASKPLDKPRIALAVACDAASDWWVAGTHSTIASSSDRGATWKVIDLGQDAQITSLQFPANGFGIAVGEFGLVVVTTDGGVNWSLRPKIPNDFYPYASLFTSERDGWVSGIAGQVLVTHDGAHSWNAARNETRQPLFRLFLQQNTPYATGGEGVLARFEGGEWREVPYSARMPVPLAAAAAVEAAGAIVIGGPGGLLRTVATPGK